MVAVIWIAALGVWFLAARESTATQTLLVAVALSASAMDALGSLLAATRAPAHARGTGAPGGGPPRGPRRQACDRGGRARLSIPRPQTARLRSCCSTTRPGVSACGRGRTGRAAIVRCAAAADPPRGGCRGGAVADCVCGTRTVGRASRAVRLWAFPERLALEVTPGHARVRPGVAFAVRATTAEAARGLVPESRCGCRMPCARRG